MNKAKYFMYDGINSREYGLILADFDDSAVKEVTTLSPVLNTAKPSSVNRFFHAGVIYDTPPQHTFSVISQEEISVETQKRILSWLVGRNSFKKFQLLDEIIHPSPVRVRPEAVMGPGEYVGYVTFTSEDINENYLYIIDQNGKNLVDCDDKYAGTLDFSFTITEQLTQALTINTGAGVSYVIKRKSSFSNRNYWRNCVFTNIDIIYVRGRCHGFRLTATFDSPYAYEPPTIFSAPSLLSSPITANIHNKSNVVDGFVYPKIEFTGNGDLKIINITDDENRVFEFKNLRSSQPLIVDNELKYISGYGISNFTQRNWLRLCPGINELSITCNGDIKITCPSYVLIGF